MTRFYFTLIYTVIHSLIYTVRATDLLDYECGRRQGAMQLAHRGVTRPLLQAINSDTLDAIKAKLSVVASRMLYGNLMRLLTGCGD